MTDRPFVLWFSGVGRGDVDKVGGKNASLGEMISHLKGAGIQVPDGFATTAAAYWHFIERNNLRAAMGEVLAGLSPDLGNLAVVGKEIRQLILKADIPEDLCTVIQEAYRRLDDGNAGVAVRSSATAEDLPEASFAGQLESYLNIQGEDPLLRACKRCFASLFTDRAISYRESHGYGHMDVAVSVGVQRMVRSDLAGSGVMFSIDTETGFPETVLINAGWGLGETIVQGLVEPDEYHVFKPLLETDDALPIVHKALGAKAQKMIYGTDKDHPSVLIDTQTAERDRFVLTDSEVLQLARWAVAIERHYGQPMDMEWAKDGQTGDLFIVQARPETVQSRRSAGLLQSFRLRRKGDALVTGLAIGDAIATGTVCRLSNPEEISRFEDGAILVAENTDPDWVPIMKRAAAIVTDHGGRTSHAAIVSRELGVPAIVGTGTATRILSDGQEVTVSCAEGDTGTVYSGISDYEVTELDLGTIPETRTRIMINVANPAAAYRWWRLPAGGVGLARMEFIIGTLIKIHPLALLHPDKVDDMDARRAIEEATRGYDNKADYFVEKLAMGVARIAAAHHTKPVIVRMSDFKTNEYARLIGGAAFEPREENPMIGWRGASRYYSPAYRDGFAMECRAMRKCREEIGLRNVILMIPFCRTPQEADKVLKVMAENGLVRGQDGLKIYVMAEIPSNVILAEDFAKRFDGFSIGSNDLTQLVLGVDRDSAALSTLFDERDPAVTTAIADLLSKARRSGAHTGICGQAPSDHPGFAQFLVRQGIESISVNPDSFMRVKEAVAAAEAGMDKSA